MRKTFALFIIGFLGIQANASNWVGLQNSSDVPIKSYIDLDSIKPYKDGDAKNSKDNYRSAFVEIDLSQSIFSNLEVVRIMSLHVVNCDQNKMIRLDSMSFDAEDNIVVPQKGNILHDSDMEVVFPKTHMAYTYSLMCSL